jgi:hypothetical protein
VLATSDNFFDGVDPDYKRSYTFVHSIYYADHAHLCRLADAIAKGSRAYVVYHDYTAGFLQIPGGTGVHDGGKNTSSNNDEYEARGLCFRRHGRLYVHQSSPGNLRPYTHQYSSLLSVGAYDTPLGVLTLREVTTEASSKMVLAEIILLRYFWPKMSAFTTAVQLHGLQEYRDRKTNIAMRGLFSCFSWIRKRSNKFKTGSRASGGIFEPVVNNGKVAYRLVSDDFAAQIVTLLSRRARPTEEAYLRKCVTDQVEALDMPMTPLDRLATVAYYQDVVPNLLGARFHTYWWSYVLTWWYWLQMIVVLKWWFLYYTIRDFLQLFCPLAIPGGAHEAHLSRCLRRDDPQKWEQIVYEACRNEKDRAWLDIVKRVDQDVCRTVKYHYVIGTLKIGGADYVGCNYANCACNLVAAHYARTRVEPPIPVSKSVYLVYDMLINFDLLNPLGPTLSALSFRQWASTFPRARAAAYHRLLTDSADIYADVGRELAAARRRGAIEMDTMVKSNEIIPICYGEVKMPRTIATPSLVFLCFMGAITRVISKTYGEHFNGREIFRMQADCGLWVDVYITYGPGRTLAQYAEDDTAQQHSGWKYILATDFSKYDLCQISLWQSALLSCMSPLLDRHPDVSPLMRRLWSAFTTMDIKFRIAGLSYIWTTLMASGTWHTSLFGTLLGIAVNLRATLMAISPLVGERTSKHALCLREFGDDNMTTSTVNLDIKKFSSFLTQLGFKATMTYGPYRTSVTPTFTYLGAMTFSQPSLHFAMAPGRVFSKLFQYHSTDGPKKDRLFEKIAGYVPSAPATPGLAEFVMYGQQVKKCPRLAGHPDVVKPRECNLPHYSMDDCVDFLDAYDMDRAILESFIRAIPGMFLRGVYEHEFFDIIFRVEEIGQ